MQKYVQLQDIYEIHRQNGIKRWWIRMNRLFYTIFSNIDIFKVIKNIFIFITECVAMNLIFLGLACFVNPDIIVKNLLTELSLKNSYALYLCIIILYEGSRNFISYAFFDRKITYIRGSTIEHMKKWKNYVSNSIVK